MIGHGLVALVRQRSHGLRVAWRAPAQVFAGTGAVPDCVLLAPEHGWFRTRLVECVGALTQSGSAVVVIAPSAPAEEVESVLRAGAAVHLDTAEAPEVLVAALMSALASVAGRTAPDRATEVAAPRPSLSVQEQRVLELYVDGLTIAATARRMGISSHTVVTYLRRIRAKFAACGHPSPSAVDLYRTAVRLGVLTERSVPARAG